MGGLQQVDEVTHCGPPRSEGGCGGSPAQPGPLCERGILRRPLLYLSHYFKRYKTEYNDRLQAIRDSGAWEPWIKFFLQGVQEVSLEATGTARRIMQMREQHRDLIVANLGKRTDRGLKLLENLFDVPVVTGTSVEKLTGLSTPNANALIQSLATLGLLKEVTGQKRNRRYIYAPYWALFSEDEDGPQETRSEPEP